jgi:hypothetical protein
MHIESSEKPLIVMMCSPRKAKDKAGRVSWRQQRSWNGASQGGGDDVARGVFNG